MVKDLMGCKKEITAIQVRVPTNGNPGDGDDSDDDSSNSEKKNKG